MKWHPVVLFCDRCNATITPETVSFRADGMFAMEGKCPHGHGEFQHVVTIEEVVAMCHKSDGIALETKRRGH